MATKRTPLEEQMFAQGVDDATAGRRSTPPTMGGAAAAAYEAGFASVEPSSAPGGQPSRGARAKPSSGSRAKPSRRPASKTARRAAGATARRTRRAVQLPTSRSRITGPLAAFGAGIALAVLYNAITHADAAAGAIEGATRAVQWVNDPTKSIPYRPGS